MDEDAAELQALRRRAYAPDADIHADPDALARLEQLEEQVRRAREAALAAAPAAPPAPDTAARAPDAADPAAAADPSDAADPADAADPGEQDPLSRPDPPDRWTEGPERPPRRRHIVVGTVLVVGALIVAGLVLDRTAPPDPEAAAPTPSPQLVLRAQDASERTLLEIPLDRSLSRYVPQPAPPTFPIEGALRWSQSLGSYYGMTVWLGRAAHTDQRCLLLEGIDKTFSRCEREDRFLSGLLDVTVPYIDIAPEDRPLAMSPGQGMVIRWAPDEGVQIALDELKVNYFG
ncbi:hypothetical protein [Microbacterium sp. NPDC064584]|uniref:hypothetical protein n=1 Tax=Microbacterium sp. NPDC064584 TaxID=3155817 RepID=UPI0034262125